MSKELNEYLGIRDAMAAADDTCKHCDNVEDTPKRPAPVIVGYLYRGEYYCPNCIVGEVCPPWRDLDVPAVSALSDLAKIINLDRSRPASFSQRDFPHTITSGQLDEPVRCDTCMEEIR